MKITSVSAGLALLLALLSSCCGNEIKDFTFKYTAESIGSYKLVATFESDSNFRIEKYNYYMDNFERKQRPVIREGRLTGQEFEACRKQLTAACLLSWADAYGFEKDESRRSLDSDLVYQFYFRSETEEKFVTYKNPTDLPPAGRQLLQWVSAFSSGR